MSSLVIQTRLGFTGKILSWLRSYLLDRRQVVNIDGNQSDSTVVRWGVPQGSALGSLIFTLYMSPIEDIVLAHIFLYYYMRMIFNSI